MYPSNTRPSTSTIKTLRNAFILNCSSQFMMHDKWHKLFLIFLLKEVKSQTSSMHVSILTACEPLLKIICLPRKTRSYLSKLCACRPIMSIVFCFWTSDLEPSENNIYIYICKYLHLFIYVHFVVSRTYKLPIIPGRAGGGSFGGDAGRPASGIPKPNFGVLKHSVFWCFGGG